MKKPARNRDKPIKVYVTDEERASIEARAEAANLSVSDYLRTVGLNHETRSVLDNEAVLALAKVNADQGRLGGLLKLWLSERGGEGASVADVKRLLQEVNAAQADLRKIVGRL